MESNKEIDPRSLGKYKRKQRLTSAIIAGIIAIGGSVFITGYVFAVRNPENIFNLSEQNVLSYLVYQKNNPYVAKPYLEQDKNYLLTYTDYIAVQNDYSALFTRPMEVSYDYRVTATVIARYNQSSGTSDNPEIMEMEYELDTQSGKSTGDTLTLSNEYEIGLEEYQRQIAEFTNTINLPVSGEVRLDFVIDLHGSGLASSFARNMTIPLTSEFFNISLNDEDTKIQELMAVQKINVWLQAAIIIIVLTAYAVMFYMIKKMLNRNSAFRQVINDYLSRYDEIFINSETMIDFSKYENVYISTLKELIQISERLFLPIIYIDNKRSATFYITNDDIVYLFTMSEKDMSVSAEEPPHRFPAD